MANTKLPPTPTGVPPGHSFWNDWYERLRNIVNSTLVNHNDLQSIQGGGATERFHLTTSQHTDLTDAGDSALHFHSADRARANHTGTQDHNATLSGLQGGAASERFHLTNSEYTGTGTGNFARETSPILVTPKATTTIGVGNTTPSASGAGISFPITQSASSDANTLDDYEEGTFTPTIEGTTTAGVGTYSTQVARYEKMGRHVFFNIYLAWTAHTGTGDMRIAGLPFVNEVDQRAAVNFGQFHNVLLTANNVGAGFLLNNSTTIVIVQYPVGGGSETTVPLDTSATITVSGHYNV